MSVPKWPHLPTTNNALLIRITFGSLISTFISNRNLLDSSQAPGCFSRRQDWHHPISVCRKCIDNRSAVFLLIYTVPSFKVDRFTHQPNRHVERTHLQTLKSPSFHHCADNIALYTKIDNIILINDMTLTLQRFSNITFVPLAKRSIHIE